MTVITSTPRPPLVIIESPYAAATPEGVTANLHYLQRCIRDAFARGEAPFASHQMYTAALDDADPAQRAAGIRAGFAWGAAGDYVAIYVDCGVSAGMSTAATHWRGMKRPIHYRTLITPGIDYRSRTEAEAAIQDTRGVRAEGRGQP